MILPNSPQIKLTPTNPTHFLNKTQKNPLEFPAKKAQKLVLEYKNSKNNSTESMELWRRVKIGIGCLGNWKEVGKKVETENVAGGVDVIDSVMSKAKLNPHHLVIMVNGLIGSSSDWKFASDEFVKQFPDKIMVHLAFRLCGIFPCISLVLVGFILGRLKMYSRLGGEGCRRVGLRKFERWFP